LGACLYDLRLMQATEPRHRVKERESRPAGAVDRIGHEAGSRLARVIASTVGRERTMATILFILALCLVLVIFNLEDKYAH
jgi:hypothetical protein